MQSFAWRSDIFFYRTYDVINPLVQILIWTSVFRTTREFAGYTKETMVTYVLVSTVFIALSRNWVSRSVGVDIKEGRLNQYLVKPLSYIQYTMWATVGRTMLATAMALAVIVVLAIAFRHDLYVPDAAHSALAVAIVIVAFVMNLFLSILVGLMAFWMTSVEGFSDAFYLVRQFLSGGMFPLNIVSPGFLFVMKALPFSYAGFVPAQVFLGQMSIADGIVSLAIVIAWTVALAAACKVIWAYGIRTYEGVGI